MKRLVTAIAIVVLSRDGFVLWRLQLGCHRRLSSIGDPTVDKLAQVLTRGTLVLSTDPAYPPQSVRGQGRQTAGRHEVPAEPAHGEPDRRVTTPIPASWWPRPWVWSRAL